MLSISDAGGVQVGTDIEESSQSPPGYDAAIYPEAAEDTD